MPTLISDPQYDPATESDRVSVINRSYDVPEARTVTTTTPEYFDIEGCDEVDIHVINASGGNYTFSASGQNDGTAAASCAYVADAGFSQYGVEALAEVAAAAYASTSGMFRMKGRGKFLRVTFDAASGTNYVLVTKRYT